MTQHRSSILANAALALGLLAIAGAWAADSLLGGRPGIGWQQATVIAAGAALALVGLFACPRRRQWIARRFADAPRLGLGDATRVALWLGLLVGIAEVVQRVVLKHGFEVEIRQPREFYWLVPLLYGAVFGVLGAACTLLAGRWWAMPVAVLVFGLATLGGWSQAVLHGSLAPLAIAVLALGIGWQAARVAASRSAGLRRLARRSTLWIIAALAVVAIAQPIVERTRESTAMAELPAAAPDAPNVVLIVLDTVCADHLGAYGYERPTTPAIDAIAADGTVFEWFFSTAPWTLSSHASMFTGRYTHQNTANWTVPLDDGPTTLAEVLRDHGYATGGFVGNLAYCSAEWGIARGFVHYEDFAVDAGSLAWMTSLGDEITDALGYRRFEGLVRGSAERVTTGYLDWKAGLDGRPFFAFLNYFDAHGLYIAPPGYDEEFGPRSPHLHSWQNGGMYGPEVMQGYVDAYDGCIHYIDDWIAAIVQDLREHGQLDNTVLIVTGDHGEQFGEHDLTGHGNSLYLPLLHLPLVISFPPRVPAATRVDEFVSLVDLPATILDLVGVTARPPLPGHSLAPLLNPAAGGDRPTVSPAVASVVARNSMNLPQEQLGPMGYDGIRSLMADGYQYLWNGDDTEELYDLRKDVEQLDNLIDTEAGKARRDSMRARLEALLAR